LQQTVKAITNAFNAIRDTVAKGGVVMFVGTKRQAQETVHDEAVRCGMPYVTERWLGGMLTNWSTMHQRIVELERMEKLFATGDIEKLTKKEALLIQREITRLNIHLSGVRNMMRVPDLILVVDVSREYAAVHEANLLNIPVIALVDTNCDPTNVDYVIPSNDDAIRAIKLLVAKMADAVEEGKALRKDEDLEIESAKARLAEDPSELDKRAAHLIDTDEELKDDELLGESTLAKMAPVPATVEVKPEELPVIEPAAEEPVADNEAGKEEKGS
jgi:small subunit ribosomal protein S2